MKILISNDDGIESRGIELLAQGLAEFGEVVVVAPHRERSTSGHSLTLHKPVRLYEVRKNRYAATGTPADCIYLGIQEIFKGNPDLIVSGINNGANLGTDIHYSGTVAAAREGALMNVKSYAISLVENKIAADFTTKEKKFETAVHFAKMIIKDTKDILFPSHTLLNVNVPNTEISEVKGVRITRQGFRYYNQEVSKRMDPRGKPYFWIGGQYKGFEKGDDTDCHYVNEGFVAVAPITIDCTHNEFYTTLSKLKF